MPGGKRKQRYSFNHGRRNDQLKLYKTTLKHKGKARNRQCPEFDFLQETGEPERQLPEQSSHQDINLDLSDPTGRSAGLQAQNEQSERETEQDSTRQPQGFAATSYHEHIEPVTMACGSQNSQEQSNQESAEDSAHQSPRQQQERIQGSQKLRQKVPMAGRVSNEPPAPALPAWLTDTCITAQTPELMSTQELAMRSAAPGPEGPLLAKECSLFRATMYRSKSQHRRTLSFRRLEEVARHIKLLQDLQLDKLVEEFGGLFSLKLLNRLFAASRLAQNVVKAIRKATYHTTAHVARLHFLKLHLVFLAQMGRMQVLVSIILMRAINSYNSLIDLVHMLPFQASDRLSVRGLPQLLRCNWTKSEPTLEAIPFEPGQGILQQAAKYNIDQPDSSLMESTALSPEEALREIARIHAEAAIRIASNSTAHAPHKPIKVQPSCARPWTLHPSTSTAKDAKTAYQASEARSLAPIPEIDVRTFSDPHVTSMGLRSKMSSFYPQNESQKILERVSSPETRLTTAATPASVALGRESSQPISGKNMGSAHSSMVEIAERLDDHSSQALGQGGTDDVPPQLGSATVAALGRASGGETRDPAVLESKELWNGQEMPFPQEAGVFSMGSAPMHIFANHSKRKKKRHLEPAREETPAETIQAKGPPAGANQKTWTLERYEGDTQPSLADLLSQSIEDFDLAEPGRHPVDATAADPGDAAPSSASKIPMKQFDSEAFSGKTGRNLALLRADTNSGQGMAHKAKDFASSASVQHPLAHRLASGSAVAVSFKPSSKPAALPSPEEGSLPSMTPLKPPWADSCHGSAAETMAPEKHKTLLETVSRQSSRVAATQQPRPVLEFDAFKLLPGGNAQNSGSHSGEVLPASQRPAGSDRLGGHDGTNLSFASLNNPMLPTKADKMLVEQTFKIDGHPQDLALPIHNRAARASLHADGNNVERISEEQLPIAKRQASASDDGYEAIFGAQPSPRQQQISGQAGFSMRGMPPTRSKGEGGWLGDPFGPQQPYPRPHEARKRVPSDSQVLFIPGLSNDLAEPLAVARQAGVSQQKRELPHDTKLLDLTEKRKRKKGKPTPKASEPTPKPSTRSWEDMLPP